MRGLYFHFDNLRLKQWLNVNDLPIPVSGSSLCFKWSVIVIVIIICIIIRLIVNISFIVLIRFIIIRCLTPPAFKLKCRLLNWLLAHTVTYDAMRQEVEPPEAFHIYFSLSLYIYIHIYIERDVCIRMCIYIYIYTCFPDARWAPVGAQPPESHQPPSAQRMVQSICMLLSFSCCFVYVALTFIISVCLMYVLLHIRANFCVV